MVIKIDKHTFKVEYCDDLGNYDGLFYPFQKKIRLLKKPTGNFKEIAIHELTHAYLWAHGHDGSFKLENEMICTFFEHFGEQIINDANRIVIDWEKKYGNKD